jgi:beta-N-acetylhexosaminidase
MQALLDLTEFQEWREDGLMVSDSLGVPAVRKYFDPQLQTFPHRQIAREAFLAGNDLLILSEFALAFDWTEQYDNIVEVLEYFYETYESDLAFAARVDDAVARILRLKLQLYPDLSLEEVLTRPEGLVDVGQGLGVVDEIARRAATVLQPTVDSLPPPPRRDEDILILTEERTVRECYDTIPECDPHSLVPSQAIERALLRLYGPEGTDQIDPARVHTLIYAQLKSFLTRSEDTGVGSLLEEAEWIVFAMLDPNPRYPNSDALQLFLAQNAHQIYNANVVVLAYAAPYYLDATEISKLTAYYVFYSKTQPFIEASIRTLFGEVRPQGKSPVSIEGTYYDLGAQLAPDPAQQIALRLIQPPEPSAFIPVTLRVRTDLIRDRNRNPVPDGTQVRFVVRDGETDQIVDAAVSLTLNGIAEADLSVDRPGRVLAVASSGDTGEGTPLAFEALQEPTPAPPSPTPIPTRTSTPTITPAFTPTDLPTAVPMPTATLSPTVTPTSEWLILASVLDAWKGRPPDLLGVLGGCLLAVAIGLLWWRRVATSRRVRLALAAWVGGLIGYLAYGWEWVPLGQWTGWPTWSNVGTLAFGGAMALIVVARFRR